MIIRSSVCRDAGISAHLHRTDTNKRVEVEIDLVRGCSENVAEAVIGYSYDADGHGPIDSQETWKA